MILYTYIVNHITTKIFISNIFDYLLYILQYQKLGYIIDICYKNCFLANVKTIFNSIIFLSKTQPFFDLYAKVALALTNKDTLIKIQLTNSVKIFKEKAMIRQIFELAAQYSRI